MKYYLLILLLLQTGIGLYSQNDSVKADSWRQKTFAMEKAKGKILKSSKIKFDSIDVTYSKYSNKIEVSSKFKNSNTQDSIEFYFENKKLIFVYVKQFAPKIKEYWLGNEFYFENGSLFFEEEHFAQSPAMHGIAIPKKAMQNLHKYYGYNINLDPNFLKIYIFELLKKIQN